LILFLCDYITGSLSVSALWQKQPPEWDIDLPGMKATYRGSSQALEQNPLTGITMTFYMAADGECGKMRNLRLFQNRAR
jgi:hypothetical protein